MIKILTNYLESCLKSIDTPMAMSEVQYSEEFLAIESEIQKLQSLEMLTPDWDLVLNLSKRILEEQAKHLKVVTYTIVALYKKHRSQGLLAGLYMLAQILHSEGDDILPNAKRKKSRPALITWMVKFISDYREMSDIGLTVEDIELLLSSQHHLIDWFEQNHPDDNPQPIIAIFDWYARKMSEMLSTNDNETLASQDISLNDVDKNDQAVEAFDDTVSEVFITESAPEEFERNNDEQQQANIAPREVHSFEEVRLFVIDSLLEQLSDSESDFELLQILMRQSRKVVWNTIYYDDIESYFEDIVLSEEYHYLHDILSIDDPLVKISQLEKLFIANPFSLELQYYICEALRNAYFKSGDESYNALYDFVLKEVEQLIIQMPTLFERFIVHKPCISENLYDWIFTEVVETMPVNLYEVLDQYLESFVENTKIYKLTKLINQSRTLDMRLCFLKVAVKHIEQKVTSRELIAMLEQYTSDESIFKYLLDKSGTLKGIYAVLLEQYQNEDINNERNDYQDKCQNILKKLYG